MLQVRGVHALHRWKETAHRGLPRLGHAPHLLLVADLRPLVAGVLPGLDREHDSVPRHGRGIDHGRGGEGELAENTPGLVAGHLRRPQRPRGIRGIAVERVEVGLDAGRDGLERRGGSERHRRHERRARRERGRRRGGVPAGRAGPEQRYEDDGGAYNDQGGAQQEKGSSVHGLPAGGWNAVQDNRARGKGGGGG